MNAFWLKYLVPQVQAEPYGQGGGCEGSSQKGGRSTVQPEEGGSGGLQGAEPGQCGDPRGQTAAEAVPTECTAPQQTVHRLTDAGDMARRPGRTE